MSHALAARRFRFAFGLACIAVGCAGPSDPLAGSEDGLRAADPPTGATSGLCDAARFRLETSGGGPPDHVWFHGSTGGGTLFADRNVATSSGTCALTLSFPEANPSSGQQVSIHEVWFSGSGTEFVGDGMAGKVSLHLQTGTATGSATHAHPVSMVAASTNAYDGFYLTDRFTDEDAKWTPCVRGPSTVTLEMKLAVDNNPERSAVGALHLDGASVIFSRRACWPGSEG